MFDRFLYVNKMNARNQKIVHTKTRNELEPPGTSWNKLKQAGTSWNNLFEIDIFCSTEGNR